MRSRRKALRRKDVRDEREKAYADLLARTHQAEQASEAKSRFLAGVSHELRTPLHTMLGFVRLALKDADGELRHRLQIAERSGTLMLKLIDELIEFDPGRALPAQLHAEPVVLGEILAQIERAGGLMAAERGNVCVLAAAADLPEGVLVDERRLLQVLQNLVDNACKYTRAGTVTIRVAKAGEDAAAGTCRLRFAVEDTGPGIAAGERAHIFDAFARGSVGHGLPGLGLGLAIARQWVVAMGGEIGVDSEPGRGSCFHFMLTLPLATAVVPADADREAAVRLANARTVLVADDVAENRLLLRDVCERWGFETIEAADGDEALQACVAAAQAIDAVLVDQFMPRMGGWEFLRRARTLPSLRGVPIVLISASTAQKPPDFPPEMAFDFVLGKPLEEDVLAEILCGGMTSGRSPPGERADDDGAAMSRVALPADDLARFRAMADLGRVEAIAEWAQRLADTDPAHGAFADRVVRLCRAADVAALERIAETATLQSPQAPPSG